MFTGIIERVGTVAAIRDLGGGKRLTVETEIAVELRVDQSISVNGVCLTVVEAGDHRFDVTAVEETLRKSNLGDLRVGSRVNLERAITANSRLDGHLVQGHVDATGSISAVEEKATSWMFTISFDRQFAPYLIPTGSVAVDGISLTVARLNDSSFAVAIIPYTYEHTTANEWRVGSRVNLEFDLLGKYVARWLEHGRGERAAGGVTMELLRNSGFLE